MNGAPPPLPTAPRTGWLNRHWKWALPTFVVFVFVLFAGAVALAVSGIFGMAKSSYPYQIAMRRAQHSPDAIAAFGAPIEPGWWLTGEMKTSGADGHASLRFPIAGPKSEGQLTLVADKRDGAWVFSLLAIDTAAGERIDLLTDDERTAATATFEGP